MSLFLDKDHSDILKKSQNTKNRRNILSYTKHGNSGNTRGFSTNNWAGYCDSNHPKLKALIGKTL